ncbi:MAG: NAD-dependent epimerase/dehydratase family protein [Candidatus Dormibacteria bacterium]
MRIAITGGTGFVGRHLAKQLSDSGHEVVLIARGHGHTDNENLALPRVRLGSHWR